MKLNKITFAMVINFINNLERPMDGNDINRLDDLIDIDVPQLPTPQVSEAVVCELLKQINSPDGYIPAIKAYRVLTGVGLKESKEAVEKYRSLPRFRQQEPATLGDILRTAADE